MPAIICLAGPAGEDKSRLRDGLAAALVGRGLKVGLIMAGPPASSLCLEGIRLEWAAGQAPPSPPSLDELAARHFPAADVIRSELGQDRRGVKVEWVPAGAAPALAGDPGLKAWVSPQPLAGVAPCFAPGQAADLAAWLLEKALPPLGRPGSAAGGEGRILVDGRRLPAKEFVIDMVNRTIRGMVGSLKGGQDAGRIEIHLY